MRPRCFGFWALFLIVHVQSVDRSNFKTCEQSSFCRSCRKIDHGKSSYDLDLDTLKTTEAGLSVELINTNNLVKFNVKLTPLEDNTLRLQIEEVNPLRQRFVPDFVLVKEPSLSKWEFKSKSEKSAVLKYGVYTIELHSVPFSIDINDDKSKIISVNSRRLLTFQHTRPKPEERDLTDDFGAWEENFKSHHDSKPNGPNAVAMDFTFHGARTAYGLPEHSDSLALQTTTDKSPYRFYNLDVFEYEIDNQMALYASIPFLAAHSKDRTTGLFWLNPSETWVDVESSGSNVVSSIVNFVGGQEPQILTHFMSESGNIDAFIVLGPKPQDVFKQYTTLTGTAPVPPLFSLGYHQSRWNYNDEGDVNEVNKNFDKYDIPMDAMWLDIEYTDGKKYFTWDSLKFPTPEEMQLNLTARGRKLVVIIDPHIKREDGYFLHEDATNNGYYVKNKDNSDYEGWCWPGASSYLDFFNPVVRDYYASRYKLRNFIGSTENLHLWNDMNEPSVFNGPEVTMPKDNIHFGGWEHREVHNLYGFMHVMTTFDGLVHRSDVSDLAETQRPFILTRSGFAGSQRFGAIWTGDNMAEWSHMKASIPMCLNFAIAGFSFCGADIPGFFHNPDRELFVRWYQIGAYLPFFRAHSHIDNKRREPWLFDEEVLKISRAAIVARYSFLPLWYTLFYQHNITGAPVIRPLWAEFPQDETTYKMQDEFLVGSSLLVRPITDPGVTDVIVYFPDAIWYDIDTHESYTSTANVPVTFSKTPVYYRGGSIIPRKMRIRRSSQFMTNDPYTLIVALDKEKKANGFLYIDDGSTHRYHTRKDSSVYIKYEFKDNKLTSELLGDKRYDTKCKVEKIIILGMDQRTYKASAHTNNGDHEVETILETDKKSLILRKPNLLAASAWQITLH